MDLASGLVNPLWINQLFCRTLSARYYRDGSWKFCQTVDDHSIGSEKDFNDPVTWQGARAV